MYFYRIVTLLIVILTNIYAANSLKYILCQSVSVVGCASECTHSPFLMLIITEFFFINLM